MTSKLANIVIRRARQEDYDAIMELGDLFLGKDYLPTKFASFIDDMDIHPMVAEADGKAIGFYMAHFVDGGKTVIKRAGRIHKSFRGRGIFHSLSSELDKYIQLERPDMRYTIFATADTVSDRAITEFLEQGFVEIYRKRLRNMTFEVRDLKGFNSPEETSHVQQMTQDDVKLLFLNDDVAKQLFPCERIFNVFIGYRLVEENIRYIINDSAEMLATTSNCSTQNEKCSETNISRSISHIDLVSCSHHYFAEKGLVYEINIYAPADVDYQNLEAHVKKHVSFMHKLATSNGILVLMFDTHVDEDKVLNILKNVGIVEFLPDSKEKHAILYERNFNRS